MEITVVAEREQVELERLALNHPFARDIRDDDSGIIRLPCERAERGELGTVESNEVLVVRMLVDKRLQYLRRISCGNSSTLVAQQTHAL